jgi:hypothetical protein
LCRYSINDLVSREVSLVYLYVLTATHIANTANNVAATVPTTAIVLDWSNPPPWCVWDEEEEGDDAGGVLVAERLLIAEVVLIAGGSLATEEGRNEGKVAVEAREVPIAEEVLIAR